MRNNFNYANTIAEGFEALGVNFQRAEKEDSTLFRLTFAAENLPNISLNMWVEEDGDVKLMLYPLRGVEKTYREDVLELLNELNDKKRFARFSLDADGDVCADADILLPPAEPEDLARTVALQMRLLTKVVDQMYIPLVMTARCGMAASRAISAMMELCRDEDEEDISAPSDDEGGEITEGAPSDDEADFEAFLRSLMNDDGDEDGEDDDEDEDDTDDDDLTAGFPEADCE